MEWLKGILGVRSMFKQLPFIVFVGILGLFYIFNVHHAEKLMREIQHLEKENKELRWQYVNAKSQLMYNSTQSQTAEKVRESGLGYDGAHPKRVEIKER